MAEVLKLDFVRATKTMNYCLINHMVALIIKVSVKAKDG